MAKVESYEEVISRGDVTERLLKLSHLKHTQFLPSQTHEDEKVKHVIKRNEEDKSVARERSPLGTILRLFVSA